MTRRLLATYLSVTLFGLALLAIPLGLTFAHRERDRLLFEIERDADGMAATVQTPLERNTPLPTQPMLAYARGTEGRVIVVDATGMSKFDSDFPNGPSSDFSSRPEIQQALNGNRDDGTRLSKTLGTHLLFAAVPTNDNGRVNGAVRITYPTATLDARIRRVWTQLSVLCLAILALVALVGFLLARGVTRPVRRLEEVSDRLARGQLDARVNVDTGPPELRHLAATFNDMATRLESVVAAEKRFVADASHQLRTPLTALRLRLENLETQVPIAQRDAIDAGIAEVTRMGRLVDGLLALARDDVENQVTIAVDVAGVAQERAEVWRDFAAEGNVALEVDAASPTWARAVPGAVDQLVDNLLDNALAVSSPGTTIRVSVVRTASDVELHVVDEGPGLDPAARVRAFDRFWRGRNPSHGGSGLGLAIVRRLAEASGGSARLDASAAGGIDAVVVFPHSSSRDRSPGRFDAAAADVLTPDANEAVTDVARPG